jgi:hypothetical protein
MGETNNTPEGASQLRDISARRRVVIGRNVTLSAGILYCLSRSIYYSTVRPDSLSGAQAVITGNGGALGLWAAAWGLACVFCVVDMVNRHTRYGLSILTGIAFAWGFGYLMIWAATGFTDYTLVSSSIGWITPAAFIFGFLLKVTALQDMLRSKTGGQSDHH